MTAFPIIQIDAFATAPFTGNPAAVMLLDAWPGDVLLQAIALENNLSETAFIIADASGEADYELRWFTPAAEVVLCGHATLASGHALLTADPARDTIRFRTRQAGILSVTRDGAGYTLSLPAWRAQPRALPAIAAACGIAAPLASLWYPTGYALLIVADEAAVMAVSPDMSALAALGPIVTIISAQGTTSDIVSRVFTPAFAIPEDPVTGSAHAVLTPYWTDVLGRDAFAAYQASARGGHIGCRLDGDRAILTGSCVTVMEGVMRV